MNKNNKSIIVYKNNSLFFNKDASNNTLFSKKKLKLSSNISVINNSELIENFNNMNNKHFLIK